MNFLSEKGANLSRKLLVRHEGIKLNPYLCTSGKLTIGVGRNIADIGISEQEAMVLLDNDIERTEKQLTHLLPWAKYLPENQKIALVNMAFNLGVGGLLTFKKMLTALEAGDLTRVEVEMLDSRWALQVGRRANEVINLMKGETDV